MRILVAEDDRSSHAQLSRTLVQQGHEVRCVRSAEEVAQLTAADIEFDLAFLVIAPPVFDGLALLDTFLNRDGQAKIPVVLCADRAERDKLVRGLQEGATDCLVSPFDSGVLRSTIARAIRAEGDAVLVVDDDEMIRNMLVGVLSRSGYKALAASGADEALAIVRTRKIGLVLSDILMPVRTGLDLVIRIREEFPSLPVVLMTGYTDRFDPDEARQAGADQFVGKPFRSEDILNTVHVLMSPERE